MRLDRGTVLLISLDPTRGHEQSGTRPCILLSDPEITADQRFPMICVVPVTGTEGEGALYPRLEPGASGLKKASYALIDQIRAVDKRRVYRALGVIDASDLAAVDEGVRLFLGIR